MGQLSPIPMWQAKQLCLNMGGCGRSLGARQKKFVKLAFHSTGYDYSGCSDECGGWAPQGDRSVLCGGARFQPCPTVTARQSFRTLPPLNMHYYQNWCHTKIGSPSYSLRNGEEYVCRVCEEAVRSVAGIREHNAAHNCPAQLTEALRKMRERKYTACVICGKATHHRKWGFLLCDKACREKFCFSTALPHILARVLDEMIGEL